MEKNKMTAVEWLVEQLRQLAHNPNTHIGMGDIRVTQGYLDQLEEQAKEIEEDGKHQAYLYGHKVGFMKAKKPTPIVENKTKNCKKEYNGKGRQAPQPPLHSKKRTEK